MSGAQPAAIPEGHPFALVRDLSGAAPEYVRSLTDLRLTLFARGWSSHGSGGWAASAVDRARQRGFNRVRAALTAVFDRGRSSAAPFDPGVPDFTCFARTGPDRQPASVDFERFDLDGPSSAYPDRGKKERGAPTGAPPQLPPKGVPALPSGQDTPPTPSPCVPAARPGRKNRIGHPAGFL